MPGPVAPRASLRTFAIAVIALPIFLYCACSSDPGTTPSCISDTTPTGIKPTDGGCNGFAVCKDDNGNVVDPHICCADMKTPDALNTCLFLYGAAPAPDNFGSGGGSSSSSTSSSGSGMDAGDKG